MQTERTYALTESQANLLRQLVVRRVEEATVDELLRDEMHALYAPILEALSFPVPSDGELIAALGHPEEEEPAALPEPVPVPAPPAPAELRPAPRFDRSRKWSAATAREFARRVDAREHAHTVAKSMGIPTGSSCILLTRGRRLLGEETVPAAPVPKPQRPPVQFHSEETCKELVRLVDGGLTKSDAGRALGVKQTTVRDVYRRGESLLGRLGGPPAERRKAGPKPGSLNKKTVARIWPYGNLRPFSVIEAIIGLGCGKLPIAISGDIESMLTLGDVLEIQDIASDKVSELLLATGGAKNDAIARIRREIQAAYEVTHK